MSTPVLMTIAEGIAHITLNRPEKRNALDRATIAALTAQLRSVAVDPAVRVVQISGTGKAFCAGADLTEMQQQAGATEAANLNDAEQLAALFAVLDSLPKPTLARVNGDGYGGALGLLAACDIVVVVDEAKFAFTEVRLGIIPAVISPFVLGKIGETAARRYFLTGETLSATALQGMGLAHEVVSAELLDSTCTRFTEALLKGAPGAQAEAKTLIRDMARGGAPDRPALAAEAAARLARLRTQPEAKEGFAAFFAQRKPHWRRD